MFIQNIESKTEIHTYCTPQQYVLLVDDEQRLLELPIEEITCKDFYYTALYLSCNSL